MNMSTKQELTDSELETMFNEYLDEVYPECSIAGFDYSTSHALSVIDPVAYRCSLSDWISNEVENEILEEVDGKYFLCN
jgi:hypothetical protein